MGVILGPPLRSQRVNIVEALSVSQHLQLLLLQVILKFPVVQCFTWAAVPPALTSIDCIIV